jgi:phosphoesterase RecJ-like protein
MNCCLEQDTPSLAPDTREAALVPIRDVLLRARSVLSIAHPFSDGDALGSQLALHRFCLANGKKSVCLNFDPLPESLSWMAGVPDLVSHLDGQEEFDVIFLMETTDVSRMGDRIAFFQKAKTRVHLDHHLDVKGLGDLNCIDPGASSTCELLYDVLRFMPAEMSVEVMEALYIGIMTDTGNFRYSNTTPRAHIIAGEMIGRGLNIARLFKLVYESNPFRKLLIHGLTMSRGSAVCDGLLVHSWLKLADYDTMGATQVDADGVINQFCSVKGVEVALLFREEPNGKVKVSFRSNGRVDVQALSRQFGGGGHRQAAGATLDGLLEEVREQILQAVVPAVTALNG